MCRQGNGKDTNHQCQHLEVVTLYKERQAIEAKAGRQKSLTTKISCWRQKSTFAQPAQMAGSYLQWTRLDRS